MRLVLDTDVVVAGFRSDQGASRQLLLGALEGSFQLLVSVPLTLEYEAVLMRSEHLRAIGLSVREVNAVLDALSAVLEPVLLRFLWRPTLKDPNDEMVLETAVSGAAHRIVTFNTRHLAAAAARFGIRAERPGSVLRNIREKR